MRRVLPNVLLLLLLLFLLPIYQATPTTEVLALSILLLGAALFLGYANQPRGLELLAALTAIVSFIGVTFLGRSVGGANGGYCFLTLWLVALLVGFGVMWRRSVVVERGQILVINQLPDNRALVWREGFHRPVNPLFERTVAALPGYELILEAVFENLNTESLFNIDRIEVVVRYQIAEPREVVFCFPNREQSREALLQERPQADTTSEQVAFWTEMIRRQMLMEVEQAIRTIIANVTGPTDVARKRDAVARQTRERLQTSVKRWGIQVLDRQRPYPRRQSRRNHRARTPGRRACRAVKGARGRFGRRSSRPGHGAHGRGIGADAQSAGYAFVGRRDRAHRDHGDAAHRRPATIIQLVP
jgi:hypothetical protein